MAAERLRLARSEAAYNERQLREEIEALRKKVAEIERQAEVGRQAISTQTVPMGAANSVNAPADDGPRSNLASLRRLETLLSRERKNRIQLRLIEKGHMTGPVSDAFGQNVRSAIAKFQTTIGRNPTGYLTPVELDRLLSDGQAHSVEAVELTDDEGRGQ